MANIGVHPTDDTGVEKINSEWFSYFEEKNNGEIYWDDTIAGTKIWMQKML